MPGIVGFTHNQNSISLKLLDKMSSKMLHHDWYTLENEFSDSFVAGLEINLTKINSNCVCGSEDIHVWFDGEIVDFDGEIVRGEELLEKDLIRKLYLMDNNLSFLKNIDGLFAAVIYDKKQKKVHLISDRYGLRHLYFMEFKNNIYFASEVKSLLCVLGEYGYIPSIDLSSLESFMALGYLLENKTWFNEISLVPSGTVLTWNIPDSKFENSKRYWWWDNIKQNNGHICEDEAAEELGRLFTNAVRKRSGGHIGVHLSGGLDSRAILAAVNHPSSDLNTLTFGMRNCEDIRIAKKAAKIKKVKHTVLELDEKNWIKPRFKGVWLTDGQADLMHIHCIVTLPICRNLMEYNLNGFAGDVILGGSLLRKDALDPEQINFETLKKFFHNPLSTYDITEHINKDDYMHLRKYDFFMLQNRLRRFTFGGTKILLSVIENRKPFYDNKLIEFAYSMPDNYRFKSKVYKKMLLRSFPDLFYRLPWQKTGMPISWNEKFQNILTKHFKSIIKIIRSMQQIDFADYPLWIKKEPARSIFQRLLLDNRNALYQQYIPKEKVQKEWSLHINNKKDYSTNLCRYLTFEIWLQQVFNNNCLDE